MAPRIKWISFGAKSIIDFPQPGSFESKPDFTSLDPVYKKNLVVNVLKSFREKNNEFKDLSVKFNRLIEHIEIDDKTNSVRLISELLLLISTQTAITDSSEVSNFLESLRSNL